VGRKRQIWTFHALSLFSKPVADSKADTGKWLARRTRAMQVVE